MTNIQGLKRDAYVNSVTMAKESVKPVMTTAELEISLGGLQYSSTSTKSKSPPCGIIEEHAWDFA